MKKTTRHYLFEISLRHMKPRRWRRFLLADNAVFQDLHDAIQLASGTWENSHLFSFEQTKRAMAPIAMGSPALFEAEENDPPAHKVTLASFFKKRGGKFPNCIYMYDFGDSWECKVSLKSIEESEKPFMQKLMAGKGNFPPEDCGGFWGFAQLEDYQAGKLTGEELKEMEEIYGEWESEPFRLEAIRGRFDH